MQKFENYVKREDKTNNILFYEKNLGNLIKLHDSTFGIFGKKFLKQSERDKFRSQYDGIFIKGFKIKKFSNVLAQIPTTLFTDFIKGITFFKQDEDRIPERPVYHRYNSCGSASKTIKEKFDPITKNTKIFLRKCYVERLVYNKIYFNLMSFQNMEHLNELKEVERLYEDTYPGENIRIQLTFRDIIYPHVLQISWLGAHKHEDGEHILETYRRLYPTSTGDSALVTCTRKHGKMEYEKVQNFNEETGWIRV